MHLPSEFEMTTPAQNPETNPIEIATAIPGPVPHLWKSRVRPPRIQQNRVRTSLRGIQVCSTGLNTPPNCVSNDDLAEHGFDSDWILQRTGIKSRYIAGPEIATSDMAAKAGMDCLKLAGVRPDQVDFILVATMTPDHSTPTTASLVQAKLGCSCPAIDINAACSGFLYGMIMASQFLTSGCARKILVIGAEKMSLCSDPLDKKTYPLFGDGAGAVLLGMNGNYVTKDYVEEELAGPANSSPGILSYKLQSLGELGNSLLIPAGGSREPINQESLDQRRQYLQMDGRTVFKWAVRTVPDITNELLTLAGLKMEDIDLLVTHQANRRIIDAAVESLDIAPEKVFVNVDRYGNTSAASIPISLHEAVVQGQIQPGSIVMLIGFGGGLTWGGCIIRW